MLQVHKAIYINGTKKVITHPFNESDIVPKEITPKEVNIDMSKFPDDKEFTKLMDSTKGKEILTKMHNNADLRELCNKIKNNKELMDKIKKSKKDNGYEIKEMVKIILDNKESQSNFKDAVSKIVDTNEICEDINEIIVETHNTYVENLDQSYSKCVNYNFEYDVMNTELCFHKGHVFISGNIIDFYSTQSEPEIINSFCAYITVNPYTQKRIAYFFEHDKLNLEYYIPSHDNYMMVELNLRSCRDIMAWYRAGTINREKILLQADEFIYLCELANKILDGLKEYVNKIRGNDIYRNENTLETDRVTLQCMYKNVSAFEKDMNELQAFISNYDLLSQPVFNELCEIAY